MTDDDLVVTVREGRPELDEQLSGLLDVVNTARTAPVPAARELTVAVHDGAGTDGELVAGLSGWTWGEAAGIAMTWVHEERRGQALGTRLLAEFEAEALRRGALRCFVTSFTFQAPGFYERHGYREIFRWEGVPVAGQDDVHLRKELVARAPAAG